MTVAVSLPPIPPDIATEDVLRLWVVNQGINWWDFVRTPAYTAWLANSTQKSAVRVRPYIREGRPVAGYSRELPAGFGSVQEAEGWFHAHGLEADLRGLEDQPEALHDIARATDQVLREFPQIRSNPVWQFGGVATYESPLTPSNVREMASDAWGAEKTLPHRSAEEAEARNALGTLAQVGPRQGGPWIFLNARSDGFATNQSILADIGFTTGGGVYGGMIHELAHVVMDSGVNRNEGENHHLLDKSNLERIARDTFHEIWNTPILRKKAAKDISIYGMSPGEEQFAEAFTRLHVPGELEKVPTKTGRDRLLRYQKLLNENVNEELQIRAYSGPKVKII